MKKLGVVIDSFSGISKKTADENGIYFLPLQIHLGVKSFLDGIDLDAYSGNELVKGVPTAKTSQVPLNIIQEVLTKASEECEHVIVLTLSSSLSGTYSSAAVQAKKFKNVEVIDNGLSGDMYFDVAKYIISLNENGESLENIRKFISDFDESAIMYIVPKNIDAFIASGRLKGAKKIIMDKLGFIPIIKFKKENTPSGVKRSSIKAIEKAILKILKFIGGPSSIPEYDFRIIYANEKVFVDMATKLLEKYGIKPKSIQPAPVTVTIHTGYGAIGISASKKVNLI